MHVKSGSKTAFQIYRLGHRLKEWQKNDVYSRVHGVPHSPVCHHGRFTLSYSFWRCVWNLTQCEEYELTLPLNHIPDTPEPTFRPKGLIAKHATGILSYIRIPYQLGECLQKGQRLSQAF